MDADERSPGANRTRNDEERGIRMLRVVNSTDLFGESSRAFGRSERREGIAAIVAITAVGEVTRDTMGEKGTA